MGFNSGFKGLTFILTTQRVLITTIKQFVNERTATKNKEVA